MKIKKAKPVRVLDHLKQLLSCGKFESVLSESLKILPEHRNSASLQNIIGIAYGH